MTGPLRGGGGAGEGGGKGKGREREGKGEGMWRGPKSGLPRGPRWLSAGLGGVTTGWDSRQLVQF